MHESAPTQCDLGGGGFLYLSQKVPGAQSLATGRTR